MGTLKIDLLGTNFSINSNENTEYLQKLLVYYKRIAENAQNIGGSKDPLKTSILAGLMLCDELYQEKEKLITIENSSPEKKQIINSLDEAEIEKRTKEMIEKISQVI